MHHLLCSIWMSATLIVAVTCDKACAAGRSEVSGPSIQAKLFSTNDFGPLGSFAKKVRAGSDPVSKLLAEALPKSTLEALQEDSNSETIERKRKELTEALNRIILRESFYSKENGRLDDLPKDLRMLAGITGDSARVSLNRMLIERTFPEEIVRTLGVVTNPSSRQFIIVDPSKRTISFYDGSKELWWADIVGNLPGKDIRNTAIRNIAFGAEKLTITVGKHETMFADVHTGKLTYFGAD